MQLSELKSRVWERVGEDATDPQRYTASMVTQFLNEATQRMSTWAGVNVGTTTISQRPMNLSYQLPADCIYVHGVRHDTTSSPLDPIHWKQLDAAGDVDRRQVHEADLRRRWVRTTGLRSTHWLVFGLKELWLWPLVASTGELVSATDDTVLDDAFTSAGSDTVNLTGVPSGGAGVWVNGLRMKRISTVINPWEYQITSNVVVLGAAPGVGDHVQASYNTAATGLVLEEVPTGTMNSVNQTFTLSVTPASGNVAVYHNGLRLKKVADSASNGEFSISGATLTLGYAPDAGDTVYADYLTDTTDHVLGETPTGSINSLNRDFTLASNPGQLNGLSVFHNGSRLWRSSTDPGIGEFSIDGTQLHLGTVPDTGDTLYADYVKQTITAAVETYTVTYSQALDIESLSVDTDSAELPELYHEALVDYAAGRCLMINARGAKLKLATELMRKHFEATGRLHYRIRNLGGEFAIANEAFIGK